MEYFAAGFVDNLTSLYGAAMAAAGITILILGVITGKNKYVKIDLDRQQEQQEKTIKNLTAEKDSYAGLLEVKELQCASLQTENDALKTKAKVLENQVTQGPAIVEMSLQLGNQHKEVMATLASVAKELGNVAKAIGKSNV